MDDHDFPTTPTANLAFYIASHIAQTTTTCLFPMDGPLTIAASAWMMMILQQFLPPVSPLISLHTLLRWLRHDPDLWTVARDDTRHSSTEVHFSTDFGCLDTMDFRFRLRRKKPKQSPQLSPFASLKSISNEDLSNGSIYQRFFGPSTDLSKSSPEAPSEQLPPAPPISPITPSITSRASRISNALRDAVRMLRLGGDGHHQQQEEDTVTLEDANSSLPPSSGVASTAQPNLSASQTRLFRQQKRPMRGSGTMSAALGGVVKIGRRSKASTVSQDSGHCNTFEVTELDEMDSSSSLDNDHFLLSLESAVFTTTPTSSAVTTVVAPLYSFTFQDGDLGDGGSAGSGLLGGWRDGLLYPPLPPGSPVVRLNFDMGISRPMLLKWLVLLRRWHPPPSAV
uniref:UDENN domain-containing protein n=1 Tax=Echinococcus granulosus TaxID=6210 RepID=A0A068WQI5_ECHGR|nr:hypothetical protein EgrG_002030600 [Echinococcus granulosus]